MSKIFKFNDHIMLAADYRNPKPYKHLAAHIVVSLDKEMQWKVEDDIVSSKEFVSLQIRFIQVILLVMIPLFFYLPKQAIKVFP